MRSSKIQHILEVAFHLYFNILRLISASCTHGERWLTLENHTVFHVVGARTYILCGTTWDQCSVSRIDTCWSDLLILNFELIWFWHFGQVYRVLSRIESWRLGVKSVTPLEASRYGGVSDWCSIVILFVSAQIIRIHNVIVNFDLDPLPSTRLMLYSRVLIPRIYTFIHVGVGLSYFFF